MEEKINPEKCRAEIAKLTESNSDNIVSRNGLSKWKTKLALCQSFEGNSYKEIDKQAVILLKNQAGTSYGLYMEIQNILKRVVNELRVEACEDLGFPKYFELREDRPADQDYIAKLRVLVPERIIESKIER